jgi:hypothetical protein
MKRFLSKILAKWMQAQAPRSVRRSERKLRPQLECLEKREVLTGMSSLNAIKTVRDVDGILTTFALINQNGNPADAVGELWERHGDNDTWHPLASSVRDFDAGTDIHGEAVVYFDVPRSADENPEGLPWLDVRIWHADTLPRNSAINTYYLLAPDGSSLRAGSDGWFTIQTPWQSYLELHHDDGRINSNGYEGTDAVGEPAGNAATFNNVRSASIGSSNRPGEPMLGLVMNDGKGFLWTPSAGFIPAGSNTTQVEVSTPGRAFVLQNHTLWADAASPIGAPAPQAPVATNVLSGIRAGTDEHGDRAVVLHQNPNNGNAALFWSPSHTLAETGGTKDIAPAGGFIDEFFGNNVFRRDPAGNWVEIGHFSHNTLHAQSDLSLDLVAASADSSTSLTAAYQTRAPGLVVPKDLVFNLDRGRVVGQTITLSAVTSRGVEGVQATIDGVSTTYAGPINSVTVNAGAGNDTINVESLAADIPLTVNLGAGRDTVNFSPLARQMDNVKGGVTINPGRGTSTVTVNDQNTADLTRGASLLQHDVTYNVTAGDLWRLDQLGMALDPSGSSLPPVRTHLHFAGLTQLVVNGSKSGNVFNVFGVADGTALAVHGGTGKDVLNFDDSGNQFAAGAAYTVTAANVTRVGSGRPLALGRLLYTPRSTASIDYTNIGELDLQAGPGANAIRVQSTAAGTATTISAGRASNVITVADAGQTLGNLAGPLQVNGSPGSTRLILDDSGLANTDALRHQVAYTVTVQGVQRTDTESRRVLRTWSQAKVSNTIGYTDISALEIHGAAGTTFTVQGVAAGTALTTQAGNGAVQKWAGK